MYRRNALGKSLPPGFNFEVVKLTIHYLPTGPHPGVHNERKGYTAGSKSNSPNEL